MEKSRYTKLWDLQSIIEESLYECGGMDYEDARENAQYEIEEAYRNNEITKEQCVELLDAMDLCSNIDWEDLDNDRIKKYNCEGDNKQ